MDNVGESVDAFEAAERIGAEEKMKGNMKGKKEGKKQQRPSCVSPFTIAGALGSAVLSVGLAADSGTSSSAPSSACLVAPPTVVVTLVEHLTSPSPVQSIMSMIFGEPSGVTWKVQHSSPRKTACQRTCWACIFLYHLTVVK
jgi:hypothetical protein